MLQLLRLCVELGGVEAGPLLRVAAAPVLGLGGHGGTLPPRQVDLQQQQLGAGSRDRAPLTCRSLLMPPCAPPLLFPITVTVFQSSAMALVLILSFFCKCFS